jgi:hypothetical protein
VLLQQELLVVPVMKVTRRQSSVVALFCSTVESVGRKSSKECHATEQIVDQGGEPDFWEERNWRASWSIVGVE